MATKKQPNRASIERLLELEDLYAQLPGRRAGGTGRTGLGYGGSIPGVVDPGSYLSQSQHDQRQQMYDEQQEYAQLSSDVLGTDPLRQGGVRYNPSMMPLLNPDEDDPWLAQRRKQIARSWWPAGAR